MAILKIGRRYINSDHIQDVVFVQGGRAIITLMALTNKLTEDTETDVSVAQELILIGREAMAIKWWLDCHAVDLLTVYMEERGWMDDDTTTSREA